MARDGQGGQGIDWRSRKLWHGLGYASSAAWMLYVVVATGNDVSHPLFNYIFIVPLAGWVAGLVIAKLLARVLPPRG